MDENNFRIIDTRLLKSACNIEDTDEYGEHLSRVTILRLEYLNIGKIGNMWMLANLRCLKLTNNRIRKIESLSKLVHLEELDLSFNSIEKIENLSTLTTLKKLSLFNNTIAIVENLENLKKLRTLSVGNNRISDLRFVPHLRAFEELRSLNINGNPCSTDDSYQFVIAHLTQIEYYNYKKVSLMDKHDACKRYEVDIVKLQNKEKEALTAFEKERLISEDCYRNEKLFLSCINEYDFPNRLYTLDDVTRLFVTVRGDIKSTHDEFCLEVDKFLTGIRKIADDCRKRRETRSNEFYEKYDSSRKSALHVERQLTTYAVESRLRTHDNIYTAFLKNGDLVGDWEKVCQKFMDECETIRVALLLEEQQLYNRCTDLILDLTKDLEVVVDNFTTNVLAVFEKLRVYESDYANKLEDYVFRYFVLFCSSADNSNLEENVISVIKDRYQLRKYLDNTHCDRVELMNTAQNDIISQAEMWIQSLKSTLESETENKYHVTNKQIKTFVHDRVTEMSQFTSNLLNTA